MADAPATPTLNRSLSDNLRSFSTRNFFIFSVVFFFALLAFIIWAIVPKINNIFDHRTQLTTVQEQLDIYLEKQAQINSVTSSNDFAQADTVNAILYDSNPYIEILYALNQVANQYNITFDRFEYSPGMIATASAQYLARQSARSAAARNATIVNNESYTVYIEAKGTYDNLVHFLHEMERYAPFNSIGYSEIANNLLGQATAQIEILALYYTPKAIINIDQPLPKLDQSDRNLLRTLAQFEIPNYKEIYGSQFTGGREDIFTLGNIEVTIPADETDIDPNVITN